MTLDGGGKGTKLLSVKSMPAGMKGPPVPPARPVGIKGKGSIFSQSSGNMVSLSAATDPTNKDPQQSGSNAFTTAVLAKAAFLRGGKAGRQRTDSLRDLPIGSSGVRLKTPVCTGWFFKRGGIVRNIKKRLFKLWDDSIAYYKFDGGDKCGEIMLAQVKEVGAECSIQNQICSNASACVTDSIPS